MQSQTRTARGAYELLIAPSAAGIYYFSVFGRGVTTSPGTFRITARTFGQYLSDVAPRTAGNKGEVTLGLAGLGFVDGLRVMLRSAGKPTLAASTVSATSATAAWARLDVRNAATGTYDVVAIWPDGAEQVLADAFVISIGIGPRLEARLDVPEAVRRGRQAVLWLDYANTGDADMPAPIFVLSSTATVLLSLTTNGRYLSETLQVLGIGPNSPAGVLRPGSRHRIPVFFNPTQAGQVSFGLSRAIADATLVDWTTIKPAVKPAEMSAALWDAVWANFVGQMGTTWRDYEQRLDDHATYLGQYGSPTANIEDLLAGFLSRAAGAYPQRTLAASRDASADRPQNWKNEIKHAAWRAETRTPPPGSPRGRPRRPGCAGSRVRQAIRAHGSTKNSAG
ncbi:MAG: hypothetical protein HC853_10210 [Anaerolineae bacterium]|nr:hypothetical protein [Anaerolineae bacterium]